MPGSLTFTVGGNSYPFDTEIFLNMWGVEPDPARDALIASGVLVEDPNITAALQGSGNYFTVPFYLPLAGDPGVYDGVTNVPVTETEAAHQSGIAWGFTKGFRERDFLPDFTGSDPMGHIVRSVADYWNKFRNSLLIGVIDATVAGTNMTGLAETVEYDSTDIVGLLGEINMALTGQFGANKANIKVLVMNHLTAALFENVGLLEFRRGVDAGAMGANIGIADILGYTAIVDTNVADNVIYALGMGAILTGQPPIKVPVALERDEITQGGITTLVTRVGGVYHPNGTIFNVSAGNPTSPTVTQLKASANYSLAYENLENIPISKLTLSDQAS